MSYAVVIGRRDIHATGETAAQAVARSVRGGDFHCEPPLSRDVADALRSAPLGFTQGRLSVVPMSSELAAAWAAWLQRGGVRPSVLVTGEGAAAVATLDGGAQL